MLYQHKLGVLGKHKQRFMTALFAFVFALNPVYGLIASQVANATNGPAITNMRLDSEAGSVYDSNKIQVLQGKITDIRVDVQSVNELDDKMTVDVYRSSARLANITLAKKTTNGYALTTSQNTANFDDGLYTLTALAKKDGDVVDTYNMVVRVDNVPDSHNVSNIIPAPGSVVTGKATPEATVENPETVSKVNMRVFKLGATNESTSFYLVRRDNSRFYKNAEDSSKLPNGKYYTIVEVTDIYGKMTSVDTKDNAFTINNTQFSNVMPLAGSSISGVQNARTLRATITGLSGTEDIRGFLYNDSGEIAMPNAPMKPVNGQPDVYAYPRTLNSNNLPDGNYQLQIKVTDGDNTYYYNEDLNNHLIIIDNASYDMPSNLRLVVGGETLSCSVDSIATINFARAEWDKVEDAESYNYEVTYGGTTVYRNNPTNNWMEGAFGGGQNGEWAFRVQSVFPGGELSEWSEYCNVILDTEDPIATVSNEIVSDDQTKLSFDISVTDTGTGIKHVAANIYDQGNTGSPLIKLGQDGSGGTSGTTRLNTPYAGLDFETRTFTQSLTDIDISELEPGTYTIRAFARDHIDRQHRFETVQFTVTTPPVPSPEEEEPENITTPISQPPSITPSLSQPGDDTSSDLSAQPAFGTFAAFFGLDGTVGATAIPEGDDDGDVLGAEDDGVGSTFGDGNILGQTASVQDASSGQLKAFGVLWYWWLVAFAVFASAWWLITAKRRKQNDDARI